MPGLGPARRGRPGALPPCSPNCSAPSAWPTSPSWSPACRASARPLLKTVGHALHDFCEPERPKPPTTAIELLARASAVPWRPSGCTRKSTRLPRPDPETLLRSLVRPASWRVTPLVANIEKSGLDAVPIIALLTFLVGAVIAFLGATVLANFGATIYTVNPVVFSFLREFAVLLTAILMAAVPPAPSPRRSVR